MPRQRDSIGRRASVIAKRTTEPVARSPIAAGLSRGSWHPSQVSRLQAAAGNRAVNTLLGDPERPRTQPAAVVSSGQEHDGHWVLPPRSVPAHPVVQRGKGQAAKKAIGWIVKVGERKLIKKTAIYTEKEMAKLLGKGYNVLVKRGKSVAKRVAGKVWGKSTIHHSGHIIKKTGKLGRPHFQPSKKLVGRAGEKGWHIFYGVAPVLFFSEDVEAMAIYEDKYPGKSIGHYLTVSKYVAKDSWLRHLDWINPGELIAIGGDIGRNIDRERTKELKAIVFTRKTPGGTVQTYELDPEGRLVRVIVVRPDGRRKDLDAATYFTMLANADKAKPAVPKDDGTGHKSFKSVFDRDYRIYNSKKGWTWDRKTLSFFLPESETAKLKRVGSFYVNLDRRIKYLYVIVHPKHREVLRQPGFLVPEDGVAGYLKARDKEAHLESLFQVARMVGLVGSFLGE